MKPRLLDQVRATIHAKHYSYRTEKTYVQWVCRFVLYHGKRHPAEMGAVKRQVAASSQSQALAAILFLYREVLRSGIGWIDGVVRAKRPSRIPVVLTRAEVRRAPVWHATAGRRTTLQHWQDREIPPRTTDGAKITMPQRRIEAMIYLIREEKVLLDHDLAALYGVETRALVQAVKRNAARFPSDFMFKLTSREFADLKSHIVISSWGGRRTAPYAFTEQGVAMLSSVLRGERAAKVNVEIMRAFVRLRRLLLSHDELAHKLKQLERRYDRQFKVVFDAIRAVMAPDTPPKQRRIGF